MAVEPGDGGGVAWRWPRMSGDAKDHACNPAELRRIADALENDLKRYGYDASGKRVGDPDASPVAGSLGDVNRNLRQLSKKNVGTWPTAQGYYTTVSTASGHITKNYREFLQKYAALITTLRAVADNNEKASRASTAGARTTGTRQ